MPATYHVARACQQKKHHCAWPRRCGTLPLQPPPGCSVGLHSHGTDVLGNPLSAASAGSVPGAFVRRQRANAICESLRGNLSTAPLATPICRSEALHSPTAKDAGVPPEPGCSRHAASLAGAHHPRCGSYCSQLQAVCMQSRGSCWADMISMRRRRCSWLAAQACFGTTGHTGGGQVCVHRQPFTGYCGRKG